jgi:hypothetical protein
MRFAGMKSAAAGWAPNSAMLSPPLLSPPLLSPPLLSPPLLDGDSHFTTAITMYRQMEMCFWLEEFEAEMRR